jgi:TonB family protein
MAEARALIRLVPVCVVFVYAASALSDEAPRFTHITHVEDSSSDRIPSVTAAPQYPETARRDRIEGEATVCYSIDKDGRIHRPAVRNSSHKIFAKPALKAIRQSSYEPLRPGQQISLVKTCRTFRFLLTPVAIEEVD